MSSRVHHEGDIRLSRVSWRVHHYWHPDRRSCHTTVTVAHPSFASVPRIKFSIRTSTTARRVLSSEMAPQIIASRLLNVGRSDEPFALVWRLHVSDNISKVVRFEDYGAGEKLLQFGSQVNGHYECGKFYARNSGEQHFDCYHRGPLKSSPEAVPIETEATTTRGS